MNKKNVTIQEQLAKEGTWIFQTVGYSMEPLLHNRNSSVILDADISELRIGDVVLYRRPNGPYVLHRICGCRGESYYLRGDNTVGREKVPKEWILGRMTAFYPTADDTLIRCTDPAYQDYVRRLPGRYWRRWIRLLPGRIIRKLRKAGEKKTAGGPA